MKTLLITGATGFVGSHLTERAVEPGRKVYVMLRKTSDTRYMEKLPVERLYCSLTDENQLEETFADLARRQVRFDAVIHCAALTKAKNLETLLRVNAEGTKSLLDCLKKYQAQLSNFILVSSLAASGPGKLGTIVPIAQEKPITDYGRSKLAAENLTLKSDIPHTIFRPTAVYGPREKDIFTLFPIVKRGLLPLIGGHKQDLTFIYVKDLVEVLLKAAATEGKNKTYFVTDGKAYEKAALGKFIQKSLDKNAFKFTLPLPFVKGLAFFSQTFFAIKGELAPLNSEKYLELKAESWVCQVSDTFSDFDFKPQYDLEKGVKETTDWYLKEGWL